MAMNQRITDLSHATCEYNVILADPPWKYTFTRTSNRAIENHYQTMELEDICILNIPAADNSILFLWATAPKLRDAFTVLDAWDFEYKTSMAWDKQMIGMGFYVRNQHELLLIATKGHPPLPAPDKKPSSIISSKRKAHSQKPAVVYDIIEQMYPDGTYLELFARNRRYGWDCYGNQLSVTHQAILKVPESYGLVVA